MSPDSRPTVGEVTISSFFHLEHFVPEVAGGPGKGFVSYMYIFVYFKPPSWYGHHLQANMGMQTCGQLKHNSCSNFFSFFLCLLFSRKSGVFAIEGGHDIDEGLYFHNLITFFQC